ncbi:hypothetical protein Pfo_031478 [Paulownia fortunei]|nr:hypothetical protein Pfo_031478 [Paulownia fortunei]
MQRSAKIGIGAAAVVVIAGGIYAATQQSTKKALAMPWLWLQMVVLVYGVGFAAAPAVTSVAKANPKTNFAIIDAVITKKNVASLTFKTEQSSYLAGVAAAKQSKSGTVGFVGGIHGDVIDTFEAALKLLVALEMVFLQKLRQKTKKESASSDKKIWVIGVDRDQKTDGNTRIKMEKDNYNGFYTVFDYEDVQLIPNLGILESRSQADTSVKLGRYTFKLPVVPANMQTVIDEPLARHLAANVDVAHGHATPVIDMVKYIKKTLPDSFVIAGNLATPEAVRDLENAGADATKVGVGPGKACITKLKTGFGTGGWQLAALRLCAKAAKKPIITDGGIRHNGDIAKSIRFGATMCMIGSLLLVMTKHLVK